jgi:hypothetical protein
MACENVVSCIDEFRASTWIQTYSTPPFMHIYNVCLTIHLVLELKYTLKRTGIGVEFMWCATGFLIESREKLIQWMS